MSFKIFKNGNRIGGGIVDDSIDVVYGGNAMGIVFYRAYPTELDNQNISLVTELTITDYNTTVDIFIRISIIIPLYFQKKFSILFKGNITYCKNLY